MTRSTRIMIIVIALVAVLCVAVTAVVSISKKNDEPTQVVTDESSVASTDSLGQTVDTQTTAALPLSQTILGNWTDSANMSGYEFFTDGKVKVTYVNLTVPVINVPINGTADGTYTINGSDLTVSFSIYSKTITKSYTVSVENNTLTLRSKEDGEVSTYTSNNGMPVSEPTSSAPQPVQSGIYGSWSSAGEDIKITINENSTANIEFVNANVPALSRKPVSGAYSGVFMLNESEKTITLQYSDGSKNITLKYTYAQSNNSLSMTDEKGNTVILARKNVQAVSNADALLGKWTDSSEMSGYEFKQGGVVDITYVNFTVPVINMPINGTYSGTYTVTGSKVTITASIYSKTIIEEYTFSVNGNTLSLVNTQDGELTTYLKK